MKNTVFRSMCVVSMLCLGGCSDGGSDSPSGSDSPGGSASNGESASVQNFSNGYVLRTITEYEGGNDHVYTTNCEWEAAEKTLRCSDQFDEDDYSTEYEYRTSDGRLKAIREVMGETYLYEYENGKIASESYQYLGGNEQSIEYHWDGDVLSHLIRHRSTGTASLVEVTWRDGRVSSLTEGNTRQTFDYGSNGYVQQISDYERPNSDDSTWTRTDVERYSYDENGNVIEIQYLDGNTLELEDGETYTWQYVGEEVENLSLTLGRERLDLLW